MLIGGSTQIPQDSWDWHIHNIGVADQESMYVDMPI